MDMRSIEINDEKFCAVIRKNAKHLQAVVLMQKKKLPINKASKNVAGNKEQLLFKGGVEYFA